MSYEDTLRLAEDNGSIETIKEILVFRCKNGINDYFVGPNGANYDDFGYPILVDDTNQVFMPTGTSGTTSLGYYETVSNEIEIIDITDLVQSFGFSDENQFAAAECTLEISNIDALFGPENITYLEQGHRLVSSPTIPDGIMTKMPLVEGNYAYNPNYYRNDPDLFNPLFKSDQIIKIREGIVVDGEIQWEDKFLGLVSIVTPANSGGTPKLSVICHDFMKLLGNSSCDRTYISPIVGNDGVIFYSQEENANKYGQAPSYKTQNFKYGFNDSYSYPDYSSENDELLKYADDGRTWVSTHPYWSSMPEPKIFLVPSPVDNIPDKGFVVRYYNGLEPIGDPAHMEIRSSISFVDNGDFVPKGVISATNWCCVIEADISYKNTSNIALFSIVAEGDVEVFWDGQSIASKEKCRSRASANSLNINPPAYNPPEQPDRFVVPDSKYTLDIDRMRFPTPRRDSSVDSEETGFISWEESTSIFKRNHLKIIYKCGQSHGTFVDMKEEKDNYILQSGGQRLGWRNILILTVAESSIYGDINSNYSYLKNIDIFDSITTSLPIWMPKYLKGTYQLEDPDLDNPAGGQYFKTRIDAQGVVRAFAYGDLLTTKHSTVNIHPSWQIKQDDNDLGYNILYTRGWIELKKPSSIGDYGLMLQARYAYKDLVSSAKGVSSIIEDIIIEDVLGINRYINQLDSLNENKYIKNPRFEQFIENKVIIEDPNYITESLRLDPQTTKNALDAISKILGSVGSNFKIRVDGTGKFVSETIIQNGAPIVHIQEKIGKSPATPKRTIIRTDYNVTYGQKSIDPLANIPIADNSKWTSPNPRSPNVKNREFFSVAAIGFNYEQDPDKWIADENGLYYIDGDFRRETLIVGEIGVDAPGTFDTENSAYMSPPHAYRKIMIKKFKNLVFDDDLGLFVEESTKNETFAMRKIVSAFAVYRRYWNNGQWVWERYEIPASMVKLDASGKYYQFINLDRLIYNGAISGTGIEYPSKPGFVLIGGLSGTAYLKTTEKAALTTLENGEKSNITNIIDGSELSVGRGYASAAYRDNYVFVVGGYNNDGYLSSIERAEIGVEGTHATKYSMARISIDSNIESSLSIKRSHSASLVIGDYIYVFGGKNETGNLSSIERAKASYGGCLSNFSILPQSLTTPRSSHCVFATDQYVYIIGGMSGTGNGSATASIERAQIQPNGDIGSFSIVGTMGASNRRSDASIAFNDDYVYIVGGRDLNGIPSSSVLMAPINHDAVSKKTTIGQFVNIEQQLNVARFGHVSAIIDSYLCVFGGNDGSSEYSDIGTLEKSAMGEDGNISPFILYPQSSEGSLKTPRTGAVIAMINQYKDDSLIIIKKESDVSNSTMITPKTDISPLDISLVTDMTSPENVGLTIKGSPLFIDYDYRLHLKTSINTPIDESNRITKTTVKGKKRFKANSDIISRVYNTNNAADIVKYIHPSIISSGYTESTLLDALLNKQIGLTVDGSSGLNIGFKGGGVGQFSISPAISSISYNPSGAIIAPSPVQGFAYIEDHHAYKISYSGQFNGLSDFLFSVGDIENSKLVDFNTARKQTMPDTQYARFFMSPHAAEYDKTYFFAHSDSRLSSISDKNASGNPQGFGTIISFLINLGPGTYKFGIDGNAIFQDKVLNSYAKICVFNEQTGVLLAYSKEANVGTVYSGEQEFTLLEGQPPEYYVLRINFGAILLKSDSDDGVVRFKLYTKAGGVFDAGRELSKNEVYYMDSSVSRANDFYPVFITDQGAVTWSTLRTCDSRYGFLPKSGGYKVTAAQNTLGENYFISDTIFPHTEYDNYDYGADASNSNGIKLFVLDLSQKINIGEIGVSVGIPKAKINTNEKSSLVETFDAGHSITVQNIDSTTQNVTTQNITWALDDEYYGHEYIKATSLSKTNPEPMEINPIAQYELQIEAFRDGANINSDKPDVLVSWQKLKTSAEFYKFNFDSFLNTEYRYLVFRAKRVQGIVYQSFLTKDLFDVIENSGYTLGLFSGHAHSTQNVIGTLSRVYVCTPAKQEFNFISVNRLYLYEKEDISYSVYAEKSKTSEWYNPMLRYNHGKILNKDGNIINHNGTTVANNAAGSISECISTGLMILNDEIRTKESVDIEIVYHPKLTRNQTVWVTLDALGGYMLNEQNSSTLHPGKLMLVDRINRSTNGLQTTTTVTLRNYR